MLLNQSLSENNPSGESYMTSERFLRAIRIVHQFVQLYCSQKHDDTSKKVGRLLLNYRNENLGSIDYELCENCEKILLYSYQRLLKCPHEEKPSCRKCLCPCYGKAQWEQLAKIMRYSGMRIGLLKTKELFHKSSQGKNIEH